LQAPSVEIAALTNRAAAGARTAADWLVGVRPLTLLAPLCVLQVLIAFWFAFRTPHNGWIWYSGGDATEYWTAQWSLAHGWLPRGIISYAVPVLYAWVPLVAGPTLIQGAAAIAPLQAIVLVPLALVCLWGVADRLFGRLFAWWAAGLWIAAPFLLLLGFRDDYHATFDQYFLVPHWFGMTNMGDLPSLVVVLGCTWATLRALDTHAVEDAVLGGLLGGLAIGVKPANGFFLLAIAVLFLATRRWRVAVAWTIALAPAILTLALWKVRGLGTLPISSAQGVAHVAAGTGPIGGELGFVHLGKYVSFNGHHLHEQMQDLREVFWSMRLLQFLAVAGFLGALRRAPAKGLFLGAWFVAFLILKGSSDHSSITSAVYYRLAEPGLPAYLLLAASIVFLVPRPGRRTTAPAPAGPVAASPQRRRAVVATAVVAGLVPLVVVAAVATPSSARTLRSDPLANDAPLSDALHVQATPVTGGTHLTWRKPFSGRTRVVYEIFRSKGSDGCDVPDGGVPQCLLTMDLAGTTRTTSATERDAGSGWQYRVAVAASYRRGDTTGDLMLVSPAVAGR
jgi:hypothetical protein